MGKTIWTRDMDRRICEMRYDGFQAEQIGAAIGQTRKSVEWRLCRLKWAKLDPYGEPFPAEKDAIIKAMAAAGKSDKEIAATIGEVEELVVTRRQYHRWSRPAGWNAAKEHGELTREGVIGRAVVTLDEVREWAQRNAKNARTLADINAERAKWGLPDFAVPRRELGRTG